MSISVRITDDYDLEKIASSGQCFRWEKIAKDGYRILHGKRCVYVESLQEQWYSFSCDEKEFAAVWTDYFDFQENYAGIRSRIDQGAKIPFYGWPLSMSAESAFCARNHGKYWSLSLYRRIKTYRQYGDR